MKPKIISIRRTGRGALTYPYPLDGGIQVQEAWGNTHGEAKITGRGRYLLVDISNLGNHHCKVILRDSDGLEVVQEENKEATKICPLCEKYRFYKE